MKKSPTQIIFGIVAVFCLLALPMETQATPKGKAKIEQSKKDKVILLPMDITVEDSSMLSDMQNAAIQGLQQKYQVYSGEQVLTELKKAADRQNHSTKKTCDETKCLQDVSMVFGNANVAMVHVKQIAGGYTLSISILNVLDNETVLANQISCEGCNAFQLLSKLKELVGVPATVVSAPAPEEPQVTIPKASDAETDVWEDVKKSNTIEDYQAYLKQYPKGKYKELAKSRLARLQAEAKAEVEKQEKQAWADAQQSNSIESYDSYLHGYPTGRYAVLAQGRVAKLKKDLTDEEAKQKREAAAAEGNQRREQAAVEAKHRQEQAAADAEAERKKRQAPKANFVSQGGLTWMPINDSEKNWSDANAYCTRTAINGQTGWRLPTNEELSSLYSSGVMNGQGGTLGSTWSSTPAGSGEHYDVYLDFGLVRSYDDMLNNYVTCVR